MSYVPMWRATARALAELGCAAFFIGGHAPRPASVPPALGRCWRSCCSTIVVRAADLEARALFVRGGLYGSVRETLGHASGDRGRGGAARRSADARRAGRGGGRPLPGGIRPERRRHHGAEPRRRQRADDVRAGRDRRRLVDAAPGTIARTSGQSRRRLAASVAVLLFLVAVRNTVGAVLGGSRRSPAAAVQRGRCALAATFWDSCCRRSAASNRSARRRWTSSSRGSATCSESLRLVSGYGVVITAGLAFLFAVRCAIRASGARRRSAGVAYQLAAPVWLRLALVSLVAAAAAVFLAATIRSTARGAYGVLARLVDEGFLDDRWRALHHRFGTPWRSIDAVAVAQIAIVLVSGGEASWIARGYAIAVVITAVLKLAALIRYRAIRTEPRAYRVPVNVTIGGHEWPLGLDRRGSAPRRRGRRPRGDCRPPSLAGLRAGRGADGRARRLEAIGRAQPDRPRRCARRISAAAVRRCGSAPRGGASRKFPGAGAPAARARASRQRAARRRRSRRRGDDGPAGRRGRSRRSARGSARDRRGAAAVLGRDGGWRSAKGAAVRLMIVPGVNVFDSVIETALRLKSSEIHIGESETLSADDQARLLGDAWERAQQAVRRRRPTGRPSPPRHALPRITWARTRPLSAPRISNTSTGSGSTSSGPLVQRAPPRCGARGVDTYGTRTERSQPRCHAAAGARHGAAG